MRVKLGILAAAGLLAAIWLFWTPDEKRVKEKQKKEIAPKQESKKEVSIRFASSAKDKKDKNISTPTPFYNKTFLAGDTEVSVEYEGDTPSKGEGYKTLEGEVDGDKFFFKIPKTVNISSVKLVIKKGKEAVKKIDMKEYLSDETLLNSKIMIDSEDDLVEVKEKGILPVP